MYNFENVFRERARIVAKHAGMDPKLAVHSMRAVTVTGSLLITADGQSTTQVIHDENDPAFVPGDFFRFRGLGEKYWVLLGLLSNAVAGTDAQWGIRNFYQDGLGIDRMSFAPDSSLADRGENASFMSLEALKSGLDVFPWQLLPAFGPNSFTDIAAFNTSGAQLDNVQVQAWMLPVRKDYEAPGYSYFTSPCPTRAKYKEKFGTYAPTTAQLVDANGRPIPVD